MVWHRRGSADIMLRLAGLALLGAAVLLAGALSARVASAPAHGATALDVLLALLCFASASAGAALAVVGRHLYDEIELSERWGGGGHERRPTPDPARRQPSAPRAAPGDPADADARRVPHHAA